MATMEKIKASSTTASSIPAEGPGWSLVDLLLDEQQQTTAVEKFCAVPRHPNRAASQTTVPRSHPARSASARRTIRLRSRPRRLLRLQSVRRRLPQPQRIRRRRNLAQRRTPRRRHRRTTLHAARHHRLPPLHRTRLHDRLPRARF